MNSTFLNVLLIIGIIAIGVFLVAGTVFLIRSLFMREKKPRQVQAATEPAPVVQTAPAPVMQAPAPEKFDPIKAKEEQERNKDFFSSGSPRDRQNDVENPLLSY